MTRSFDDKKFGFPLHAGIQPMGMIHRDHIIPCAMEDEKGPGGDPFHPIQGLNDRKTPLPFFQGGWKLGIPDDPHVSGMVQKIFQSCLGYDILELRRGCTGDQTRNLRSVRRHINSY
ncbi:MAG: hypothetical protein NTY64_11070, partial [Deltaproteobacteria bacterium]|nr:hypothetical protein [Deltaproteobacteria bacterium]